MKKTIRISLVILLMTVCSLTFSYGRAISSNDLIRNAKVYDGKTVEYEGEVIGDIMDRGGFAWLNVLNGEMALGIWADSKTAGIIKTTGDYFHKGDIVRINGTFNRACLEHGGDLDIHAESIKIVSEGSERKDKMDFNKLSLIIILSIISICLLLIYRNVSKP